MLFLLFHATNLFLCGHEWVKRLSSEALHPFICALRHQRVEHSSPPLHVPYSLQHNFYSYSRQGIEKPGGWDECLQKETHRTTPNILFSRSAHRCCNTTAYPKIQLNTCAIHDSYKSGNKVNFNICSVVTK